MDFNLLKIFYVIESLLKYRFSMISFDQDVLKFNFSEFKNCKSNTKFEKESQLLFDLFESVNTDDNYFVDEDELTIREILLPLYFVELGYIFNKL